MNIFTVPYRVIRTMSLFLANNGPRFYLSTHNGWSLSGGFYRTDDEFALSIKFAPLEYVLGPFSSIMVNLGWVSIQVQASYGYGKES